MILTNHFDGDRIWRIQMTRKTNTSRPQFFTLTQVQMPVGALTSIAHRISGILLALSVPFGIYLLKLSLQSPEGYEQAANLFAPGAEVVQPGQVLTLRTHTEAVQWNARLPCAGRIVSIESEGQTATATFELGDRPHSRCDGPGEHATAVFKVVKGKIVLWHQTGSSEGGPAI